MSKKSYSDRNLKFETLQLHVGQESPDPVTRCKSGTDLPDIIICFSVTVIMQQQDLV